MGESFLWGAWRWMLRVPRDSRGVGLSARFAGAAPEKAAGYFTWERRGRRTRCAAGLRNPESANSVRAASGLLPPSLLRSFGGQVVASLLAMTEKGRRKT